MRSWKRRYKLLAVTAGMAAAAGAAWGSTVLLSKRDCYSGTVSYCINRPDVFGNIVYPGQTPYWQGKPGTDEDGLPVVVGPNGERFRNMSSIALVALPRSTEPFANRCKAFDLSSIALKAISFLEANQKEIQGRAVVWRYDYPTQLNDVVLDAGWPSAFAQAAIVQLLMLAHCKTGNAAYQSLAMRAADAFAVSVAHGGLRSESPHLIWFQEVPLPDQHNPFIFNAHLYAVETLLLMHRLTDEPRYRDLAMQGIASIEKALPVIDTGNWNRYDLRPRSQVSVCWKANGRNRCRYRTAFSQEFDPADLAATANRIDLGDRPTVASARPILGEMTPLNDLGLRHFNWGWTAKEYLPWHAELIRSIGRHADKPEFIAAGDRWMRYYADYQRDAGL